MRRCLLPLLLLCLPALAPAGQLTFTPATLVVDNRQSSAEVLLTYSPGEKINSLQVDARVNLDRLGWVDLDVVPHDPSAGYTTYCRVLDGQLSAIVVATGQPRLTAASIPVCRLRVRPHAHTPRGTYSLFVANYYEFSPYSSSNVVTYNSVRVTVP